MHLLLEPDDVVLALGLHTLRCALHRPQKHQPPRRPGSSSQSHTCSRTILLNSNFRS